MDARVRAAQALPMYDAIDERTMTATCRIFPQEGEGEGDIWAPCKIAYEVCPLCQGKGRHVNPSIDANGLTQQDFEEADDYFEEDYLNGVYDVACYQCGGKRVVPEISQEGTSPDTYARFVETLSELAHRQREREAEEKWGY